MSATDTFGDPAGEQRGDGIELKKPRAHGRSKRKSWILDIIEEY